MDGSTTAIIVIPIVTTLSLALGIFTVYWAAAHPRNDTDARPRAGGRGKTLTAHPEDTSGTPANYIPYPRQSPDYPAGRRQTHQTRSVTTPAPPRHTVQPPMYTITAT